MLGTIAFIIAASTLAFTILMSLFGSFNLVSLGFIVIIFNIIQWLIAPYLINAMYKVKEVTNTSSPKLYRIVQNLSAKSGLKMPKVMIANIPIPNAFAYGSPLKGNHVAVTKGLLNTLEEEEVEAVVGHELGHLKHKDVQVMMFASLLPAVFYFIGYSFMMSAMFGGGSRRGEGGAAPVLIGVASMAIYWILSLFVLGLSRLREYYADQHSASIVEDGPRKLSEGLAKIVSSNAQAKMQQRRTSSNNSFKTLFIDDPDSAENDLAGMAQIQWMMTDQQLVRKVLSRKVSSMDSILELFSSHPNIVKRLTALHKMA